MSELTRAIDSFVADHALPDSTHDSLLALAFRRDTQLWTAYTDFVKSAPRPAPPLLFFFFFFVLISTFVCCCMRVGSRFDLSALWVAFVEVVARLTRDERARDDHAWQSILRMHQTGLLTRTDTRYLRDLLSINEPILDDAFELYRAGLRQWEQLCEIVCGLVKRWKQVASPGDRLLLRLLESFAADKVLDAEQLDTLEGLVYEGDPTLHAAFTQLTDTIEETNRHVPSCPSFLPSRFLDADLLAVLRSLSQFIDSLFARLRGIARSPSPALTTNANETSANK
jgi:hypothetical protein